MKRIYPFALLLILAACQKEEKKVVDHSKSDWAYYKFNGNVESISERSYEVKNESLDKGEPKRENAYSHDFDLFFNDEGKLVLEKKYLKNTILHEVSKYDGRNKKLLLTQYMSGNPIMKSEYGWDKTGNNISFVKRNTDNSQITRTEQKFKDTLLIEQIEYNSQDILTNKTKFIYDDKGRLKEEHFYFKEPTVQFRNVYDYDDEGRKIKDARYKGEELDYTTLFTYEGNNLASRETTEGTENKPVRIEKFSYDANGNLAKEYMFDAFDKSETIDEYKYDSNKNMIQRTLTENKKVVFETTNEYDTKGNLSKTITVDAENTPIQQLSYTYEYDDKGNWIKKTVYKNDEPFVIVERNITYFE